MFEKLLILEKIGEKRPIGPFWPFFGAKKR